MAYGVKYQCEWTSPMRDRHRYKIQILERDYTGNVMPIYPTGNVLTITQGKVDDTELEPMKGSEAVLSLLCIENGDPYLSLFTTDPMQYKLRVYQMHAMREFSYWEGFLMAGTYSQEYALPPYRVEVHATDGIAVLKNLPFVDAAGNRYTGQMSLADIVSNIIARISDLRVQYPYPLDNVVPAQSGHTMSLIGVDMEGLYSALGNDGEAPSCYDVIEAVLRSVQSQLFLSYGSWVIRPIISLATKIRAQSFSDIVNNGNANIPIYSDKDDGVGMSTSSTLSLLPPYTKVNVSRPSPERVNDVPSMLCASRWHAIWGGLLSLKSWNHDSMRMAVYPRPDSESRAFGAAYVCDGILEQSDVISVEVSLDAYNLAGAEKTFKAGLLLVAEGSDPIASWNYQILNNVNNVAVWKDNAWVVLSQLEAGKGDRISPTELVNAMSDIALEASSRYVLFDIKVPTSQLKGNTVNLAASHLSSGIATKYRLVVVFAGAEGVPAIELHAPSMVVQGQSSVSADIIFDEVAISANGLQDITYEQTFADSWVLPVENTRFEAPLLNLNDGDVLRGFVVPAQRQLMVDLASTSLRKLRGSIMRQIDGEVYVPTNIDLNAIFVERDGRRYYTNYIKRLVSRGLYSVQLRELPVISAAMRGKTIVFDKDITNVVSMDTSAMWLSMNGRNLYRFDAQLNAIKQVMTSPTGSYALSLNAGQCCASVVSFDGTHYTLTAFNTQGEVISKIEQAQLLVQVYDTALVDVVMRSAMFDANINTWSLIGGNGKVTYFQVLSGDGYNVSSHSTTWAAYTNAYAQTLIPNGYAYTGKSSTTQSLHTTYWHSFAHHAPGGLGVFGDYKEILACNEVYLLINNSSKGVLELYHRTDTQLGCDATPLMTVNASTYSFVAMNNALVLFRSKNSYGAVVYDGRTGNLVSIGAPLAIATTILWLCGDVVYGAWVDSAGAYNITSELIINGAGDAPKTTMLE